MKYFLALAFALTLSPAFANDEDDGTGLLMKRVLSGLGIIESDKAPINYRERPPLVLPPSVKNGNLALPAPQNSIATQNANWPKEPDDKKAIKTARPVTISASQGRKLTPDEMSAARSGILPQKGGGIIVTEPTSTNPTLGGRLFSGFNQKEELLEFKGEGIRSSLIEPPPGYRTPSANQPFGPVGKTVYKEPTAADNEKVDAKRRQ